MEDALNIAKILQGSQVSGPGLRDLIWVQGCSIGCKGCFNQHLWSYEPKHIVPVSGLAEKFASRVGRIEGITILGGEPTEQAHSLSIFLESVQELGLSTVVYTGKIYEHLLRKNDPKVMKLLEHTDILVDGPYVEELNTQRLLWRGSTNQRILFLSDRYDVSILSKVAPPNQELHIFVDGEWETRVQTGIE
jgi:anaerobic ribonucleoside-triphosphate reductase activating protein